MPDALRIGFIGCGMIAHSHARNLAAAGGSVLSAVHDRDRDRAEAFAARHGQAGTVVANSTDEVIAASDAVYVCTWTSEHSSLVKAIVEAGRAVFCEKPLAMDLATAQEMTAAVQRAGVIHQVGLVLRHSPSFRFLRQQINTPDAGRLMNIVFRNDQYLPVQGLYGSTWRADRSLAGGGALLEHSIHDLDLLTWMMGPIARVSAAIGFRPGMEGIDDQVSVVLESHSGAQATLVSVWHDVLSRPSQRRVEVFCQGAMFTLSGDWTGPVSGEMARTGRGAGEEQTSLLIETREGDELAAAAARGDGLGSNPDAAFVEAVRTGRAAYPDFTLALEGHRLADAAYRSAACGGQPVELA